MNTFVKQWHEARKRKKSNIIVGLDPAPYNMGRADKGLREETDLLEWSLQCIEAVAPYAAGIKPNQAYFQTTEQRVVLSEIVKKAKELGLLIISDNKIADIGSTNDAWIFYNKEFSFDALTCAPYAGNIEASIEAAHARDIGIITMGLMSNPEYKSEMNFIDEVTGESLWKSRVRRSVAAGVDGIVVGGTYTTDDTEFMDFVEMTNENDVLYLIPGIGAQGGTIADFLASGINSQKCMVCSSRGVMFANGSHTTPEEQGNAAKSLQDSFNQIAYD